MTGSANRENAAHFLLVAVVLVCTTGCAGRGSYQPAQTADSQSVQAWIDGPQYEPGPAKDVAWFHVKPNRRMEAIQMLVDRKFIPLTSGAAQKWLAENQPVLPTGNVYLVRCVTWDRMTVPLSAVYYPKGLLLLSCVVERGSHWRELKRTPIVVFVNGELIDTRVNIGVPYP